MLVLPHPHVTYSTCLFPTPCPSLSSLSISVTHMSLSISPRGLSAVSLHVDCILRFLLFSVPFYEKKKRREEEKRKLLLYTLLLYSGIPCLLLSITPLPSIHLCFVHPLVCCCSPAYSSGILCFCFSPLGPITVFSSLHVLFVLYTPSHTRGISKPFYLHFCPSHHATSYY